MNRKESRVRDAAFVQRMMLVVLASLDPLLDEAALDTQKNKSLFALFLRLDLLTTVTFVPWSRFPYHRNTLRFDLNTLREEGARRTVASVVAENIVMLLARESSRESEALLLLRLDSAHLKHCLGRFYINEFTGDAVARELISLSVEAALAAQSIEGIIEGIGDKKQS